MHGQHGKNEPAAHRLRFGADFASLLQRRRRPLLRFLLLPAFLLIIT